MQSRSQRSQRPSTASASAASSTRSGIATRAGVRPPTTRTSTTRTSSLRHQVSHHAAIASRIDRTAAPSPAESMASAATTGTKRKDRDFDVEPTLEETNINVVVRCRGRNEREVRENSAVVVETEGAKGKLIELSMGPSALSNKTYNFDRVFSQAADQSMVYDDVVKPILEEVCRLPEKPFVECVIALHPADILFPRCWEGTIAQFLPTARPALARHIPCLVT